MTDPYINFDGLEDAIIGFAWPWQNQKQKVAVYDYEKILAIFMERDGMTSEEAAEFIDFNVDGAYLGEQTPIIIFMGGDDDTH
jgi:hypothetical protein